MSETQSRKYHLAPATGLKVTITLSPQAYITSTATTGNVQSVTIGEVGSTQGVALDFTIHNDSKYAEGHVTVEYGNVNSPQSASCHIDFFLSGDTFWSPHTAGFPNSDKSILPGQGNTGNIPIIKPTGSTPSGIPASYQVLNKSMVFLVDKKANGNLVFRGNSPLSEPKTANGPQPIDFKILHNYLKERYEGQTGLTDFPEMGAYILRDVCLLSPQSEAGSMLQELKSFGGNDLTQLDNQVWYKATPTKVGNNGCIAQISNWSIEPDADGFDLKAIKELSDEMDTQNDKPNIYYIHCASGHDRTGIAASTYLIKNRNMGLSEAFIYGTTVAKLSSGTGQLQGKCLDLDGTNKGNEDPNRSRVMLIADVYNETVEGIYKLITGKEGTISSEGLARNPANVYDNYPWNT